MIFKEIYNQKEKNIYESEEKLQDLIKIGNITEENIEENKIYTKRTANLSGIDLNNLIIKKATFKKIFTYDETIVNDMYGVKFDYICLHQYIIYACIYHKVKIVYVNITEKNDFIELDIETSTKQNSLDNEKNVEKALNQYENIDDIYKLAQSMLIKVNIRNNFIKIDKNENMKNIRYVKYFNSFYWSRIVYYICYLQQILFICKESISFDFYLDSQDVHYGIGSNIVFTGNKLYDNNHSICIPDAHYTIGMLGNKQFDNKFTDLSKHYENKFVEWSEKYNKAIIRASKFPTFKFDNQYKKLESESTRHKLYELKSDFIDNDSTFITPKEMSKYKILLHTDGIGGSWDSLAWKLLSGSLVIYIINDDVHKLRWIQWFDNKIKAYEHYIPCTLENLEKTIDYYLKNQTIAKEIGFNGYKLAKEIYNLKNSDTYYVNLITSINKQYCKKLFLQSDTRNFQNIQYRNTKFPDPKTNIKDDKFSFDILWKNYDKLNKNVIRTYDDINMLSICCKLNETLCESLNIKYLFKKSNIENDFHPTWIKIKESINLIDTYTDKDVFIWCDCDAWIRDQFKLNNLINQFHLSDDLIWISEEPTAVNINHTNINTGFYMFKKDTKEIFTKIYEYVDDNKKFKKEFPHEQKCMNEILKNYKHKLLDYDNFNTPAGKIICHAWNKEKFLVLYDIIYNLNSNESNVTIEKELKIEHVINEIYKRILKREVDSSGIKTYINSFNLINVNYKLSKILYESDEYKNLINFEIKYPKVFNNLKIIFNSAVNIKNKFEFENFFNEKNCIFIKSKSVDWYQDSIEEILENMIFYLSDKKIKNIELYGYSMGGYGAALFAILLSNKLDINTHAICINPQTNLTKEFITTDMHTYLNETGILNKMYDTNYNDLDKLKWNNKIKIDIHHSNNIWDIAQANNIKNANKIVYEYKNHEDMVENKMYKNIFK